MLLPLAALSILHRLRQHGYEAYIVGGAVRDLLLPRNDSEADKLPAAVVTDFDFTTNALPEQIIEVFPDAFYENTFGTVSITHEHLLSQLGLETSHSEPLPSPDRQRLIDPQLATKLHESLTASAQPKSTPETRSPDYQITTYRSDEVYDDFRRPTSMKWGKTLQEDLERRDFTINAMALAVPDQVLNALLEKPHDQMDEIEVSEFTLVDPFAGQADLANHVIKSVGQATTRFQEDALRMLRAIRFAVQLNLQIQDETFAAIQDNAALLANISAERIRDEFLKILKSRYPAEGIELLDVAGLLQHIVPELLEMKGVAQAGHHTTDVWVHSLDALRYTPASDPIVRLATLLHDIAKPQTQRVTADTITFYNHELVGARLAKRIAERLKLSKAEINRIFILVRFHMFHYQPHNTDAAIRRFMRNVGLENIDDILDLREGDRLGSGARQTSWRLEEMKARMQAQLHQPFSVKDLAINGDDLMAKLELKPGPQIGRVLNHLFELVMEDPDLNNEERLLSEARSFLAESST